MKFSRFSDIHEVNALGIEKPQRKILSKTRQFLIRPLINFWRFSCYYGQFIAYRR